MLPNKPITRIVAFGSFMQTFCEEIQDFISNKLLQQNKSLFFKKAKVEAAIQYAVELNELANKVINKQKLSKSESKQWRKIRRAIQDLEENIQPGNRFKIVLLNAASSFAVNQQIVEDSDL